MYKNTLEKLRKFFEIDIRKNPEEIFNVLKEILDFTSGSIILSGKNFCSFHSKKQYKCSISEDLKLNNAVFGNITISREKNFNNKEKNVFKTCSIIISNLIKDAELSKIISQQVKTLQEGIFETNKAYKSVKTQNDYFSNFSHELKTPLNAVLISSELLADGIFGTLNEKQTEYINDIRIASLHLSGMINDILDITKLESGTIKLNLTNFDLEQNVLEVCNIVKPLAEKKNLKIVKNFAKNIKIQADYTKIQQILFNLLSNAIKYTPENGTIWITSLKKDKNIIIKVKDNGLGIKKEYQTKIFEKFFRLGDEKSSNGLGLTITQELIKLHNGKIHLKSAFKKGSEFIVTLPE